MNATRRSRNRAVAAVDQLDAHLDECLSRIDLSVLCAMIDNITVMGNAVAKDGPQAAFMADRLFWRIFGACAMKRLNDELARRYDQESEVPDVE